MLAKKTLVGLVIVTSIAISCADKKTQPVPEKMQKPLPSQCDEKVSSILKWSVDQNAVYYVVNIGLRQNDYYQSEKINGLKSEYEILLDRNLPYFIQVDKINMNSETISRTVDFFIPSCENRTDWKNKNPSYEEPRVDTLNFNSL